MLNTCLLLVSRSQSEHFALLCQWRIPNSPEKQSDERGSYCYCYINIKLLKTNSSKHDPLRHIRRLPNDIEVTSSLD